MSLSENLYNLGALLKTNLETKGINGLTGNEGLTTLANKILDIECKGSSKNVVATVTGNSITLGNGDAQWLLTTGDVIVDWGDGSTDTVNNPDTPLTHTYSDGLNEHLIIFDGTVTSLGKECFYRCSGLTRVVIPDSVTSLGKLCFNSCSSLIDYQLYWTGNDIITYDSSKMQDNTNTIFTIPSGETANYTAKGYPTGKLVERGETLTLTCDKPIIQNNETSTVTATLKDTGTALTGKTLSYTVKHGTTTISSGTKTTNNQGQATISYVGTGVGDVSVEVRYGTLLQEIYIEDIYYNNPTEYIRTTEYTTERYVPLSNPVTFTNNDWEVSFDLSAMGACGFGIFDNSQYVVKNYVLIGGSSTGYRSAWWGVDEAHESSYNFGGPTTSYFNYKIVKQGTTLELYENGTLKKTVTGITFLDGITHEIGWVEWKSGKTVKIKNVQIRVS